MSDTVVRVGRRWMTAAMVTLCSLILPSAPLAQSPSTLARPVIKLEKTRFASDEQVFFWVGVEAPDNYRIPQNLWTTGRLTMTRPDGTERIDALGWPRDGDPHRGWMGGHGLRSERPQIGRYTLVLEFAGEKTRPYSFTVEDVPILKEISAEFVFPTPLLLGSPDALVRLTVRNRSNQTIQFPHRGEMFGYVWVSLDRTTGEKWSSSFPVPDPVLRKATGIEASRIAEDTFSWRLAGKVPTVVLAPGDTYRLDLPLNAVLAGHGGPQPIPDGEYDVRLSTIMQMLVGQPDGAWADLAPIRWNVTSRAHGILAR